MKRTSLNIEWAIGGVTAILGLLFFDPATTTLEYATQAVFVLGALAAVVDPIRRRIVFAVGLSIVFLAAVGALFLASEWEFTGLILLVCVASLWGEVYRIRSTARAVG